MFDLFGTCNLRLFRVPTVPEEMKFAKYPSACGEDLHLKFQTRASEPPSRVQSGQLGPLGLAPQEILSIFEVLDGRMSW